MTTDIDNYYLAQLLGVLRPLLSADTEPEILAHEISRVCAAFADSLRGVAAEAAPGVAASLAAQARAWLDRAAAAATVPVVRSELLATGLEIGFALPSAVAEAFPAATDGTPIQVKD